MKSAVFTFAAALIAASASLATAGETTTVTGHIVYVNCYLKFSDLDSDGYKACSAEHTRRGQSLALAAADGLYIIKGDWTKNKNERLTEFIDQKVQATGEVTQLSDKKLLKITDVKSAS
jgi:hypothetical protein